MAATVDFLADSTGRQDAFRFTHSLVGYRVATAFQPYPAGTPLLGFAVQLFVARTSQAPNRPAAVEDSGRDVGEHAGRPATVTVTVPGREAYTFRKITLQSIAQRAFCRDRRPEAGHLVVHVAALNFEYLPAVVANTNAGDDRRLIDMQAAGTGEPVHTAGTAGFQLPSPLVGRAKQQLAWPAGESDFAKGVEMLAGLRLNDGTGAVALEALRDGRNGWANALLVFNAAQHLGPPASGTPAAATPPAAQGGEMTLHINSAIWPATRTALTSGNVGAYFVEEVWGWGHHFDPLTPSAAVARVPVMAKAPVGVGDWLNRPLDALDTNRIVVADPVVGAVTERVCIRFRAGVRDATLFT